MVWRNAQRQIFLRYMGKSGDRAVTLSRHQHRHRQTSNLKQRTHGELLYIIVVLPSPPK